MFLLLMPTNQQKIESEIEITDTKVPAIQENTSVLADSNETRQFKEIAQDLNTLANNETVRNFSIAVKESINLISE